MQGAEPRVVSAVGTAAGVGQAFGVGRAIRLSEVADTEGLSVADQVALQDAELRQKVAGRVMLVFGLANVVTLVALAALVALDQYNIVNHLIAPSERIIASQAFMALLGATTVQVGTIAAIIARYLFPGRAR